MTTAYLFSPPHQGILLIGKCSLLTPINQPHFIRGERVLKNPMCDRCLGKVSIYPNVLGSSSVEVKSLGHSTDSWQCLKPNQHLLYSYNKDVYTKILTDTSSSRTRQHMETKFTSSFQRYETHRLALAWLCISLYSRSVRPIRQCNPVGTPIIELWVSPHPMNKKVCVKQILVANFIS